MPPFDPITNRHAGKTIFVAGTSPFDPGFVPFDIPNSVTIGVNNASLEIHCDHLLICDTHRIKERMPHALDCLPKGSKTFFSRDVGHEDIPKQPDYWFTRPRGSLDNNCWPVPGYKVPNVWREVLPQTGVLQHVATAATAAVNLAFIMGAARIILYRVDLIGNTHFGKVVVPWAEFEPRVSEFLKKIPVPVYKTNPDSPIAVPLITKAELLHV